VAGAGSATSHSRPRWSSVLPVPGLADTRSQLPLAAATVPSRRRRWSRARASGNHVRMHERPHDVRARSVELVSLAPFYDRFRGRIEGLTDDEYLWEPVPGCLTVRPDDAGSFVTGGPPAEAPVTTIAWRICHIGDFLRHERNWRWLGQEPEQLDRDIRHPLTAVGAIDYVDSSWASWQRLVSSLTPDEMWEPIGPIAGPYGDSERIGLVIHIMDELIHHAAEVGVMRDLYAAAASS
jgi:DinB superfamily